MLRERKNDNMLASECITRIQELIEIAGDVEIVGIGDNSDFESAAFDICNVKPVRVVVSLACIPSSIKEYDCTDNENSEQVIRVF